MAREHPDVPHGERRAEGGHRVFDTRLMQGDHIGVALHHDGHARRGHGGLRVVEPVEHLGLVEQRRLAGVQVLRLAGADDAAAEGDAVARHVEDGEHHPIVEAVTHRTAPSVQGHVGGNHVGGLEAELSQVPHERAAAGGEA